MMMRCPCCGQTALLDSNEYINVKIRKKLGITVMDCCDNLVIVSRTTQYDLSPYMGESIVDDWGREGKKVKSRVSPTYRELIAAISEKRIILLRGEFADPYDILQSIGNFRYHLEDEADGYKIE